MCTNDELTHPPNKEALGHFPQTDIIPSDFDVEPLGEYRNGRDWNRFRIEVLRETPSPTGWSFFVTRPPDDHQGWELQPRTKLFGELGLRINTAAGVSGE